VNLRLAIAVLESELGDGIARHVVNNAVQCVWGGEPELESLESILRRLPSAGLGPVPHLSPADVRRLALRARQALAFSEPPHAT